MLKAVEHFLNLGVTLYVVELVHGDRPHVLQLAPEVTHIKLRTKDIMWHKENQMDIGARAAIRNNAKYLMFADGDIQFTDHHIATNTIEALQLYPIVQPWQYAMDLDHRHNVIADERGQFKAESFCSVWRRQQATKFNPNASAEYVNYSSNSNTFGHFGFCWAYTTEAYLNTGGMLDWIITGAADYFMSLGYAGILDKIVNNMDETATPGYRRRLLEFHSKCETYIKGYLGYVPGTIYHGWHGPKAKRGYLTRPAILKVSKFDPDLDLTMDEHGLLKFTRDNRLLRDGLDNYFYTRDEDALAN